MVVYFVLNLDEIIKLPGRWSGAGEFMIIMAKINKYWGYVAIGALTAAAAGAVAALIAKKGSCKEDFDFEDDFDDFDLTDEKETAKEDQEPAEDFQSWEHTGEQSATDDTESEEAEEAADRLSSRGRSRL